MDGPQIGEVRTANGETRKWTGAEWEIVPPSSGGGGASGLLDTATQLVTNPDFRQGFGHELKNYAGELATGHGPARTQVKDYAKGEASGFAKTANPLNLPGAMIDFVSDPNAAVTGMANTARGAVSGDPEAMGSVLGMTAAPGVTEGLVRGGNTVGRTLATNPTARRTAGYALGAGAGIAAGTHPFMGAIIGRAASPLLEYPGRALESFTNPGVKFFDKIEGRGASPFDPFAPNKPGTPDRGVTPDLPNGAPMVDPHAPNTPGTPDRGVDPGHILSSWAPVDQYAPNTPGVVDRGTAASGAAMPPMVDRYSPNTPGTIDRGVSRDVPEGFPVSGIGSRNHITSTERAALIKQGYTPELIDRLIDRAIPPDAANRARNAPYGEGGIMPSAVRPSEFTGPQEGPTTGTSVTVKRDLIPPAHGDPSLVAHGEEAAYNDAARGDVRPSTDDLVYQAMHEQLGGRLGQPAPDAAGRPKLTTTQAAQLLRDQYGSDKAARMLYGPSHPGSDLTEASRIDAIKRNTAPGPYPLPAAARATIDEALSHLTTDADRQRYLAQAPNPLARAYIASKIGSP